MDIITKYVTILLFCINMGQLQGMNQPAAVLGTKVPAKKPFRWQATVPALRAQQGGIKTLRSKEGQEIRISNCKLQESKILAIHSGAQWNSAQRNNNFLVSAQTLDVIKKIHYFNSSNRYFYQYSLVELAQIIIDLDYLDHQISKTQAIEQFASRLFTQEGIDELINNPLFFELLDQLELNPAIKKTFLEQNRTCFNYSLPINAQSIKHFRSKIKKLKKIIILGLLN